MMTRISIAGRVQSRPTTQSRICLSCICPWGVAVDVLPKMAKDVRKLRIVTLNDLED